MRSYTKVIFLIIPLLTTWYLPAQENPIESIGFELDQQTLYQRQLSQRDQPAVKQFIIENRGEDLKEKNKDLNISGDVRSQWQHIFESARGVPLRGGGAVDRDGIPLSQNDFDVEYNFRLDYRTEDSWAVAHLKFDDGAGTGPNARGALDPQGCAGSGEGNRINLRQAYLGYRIFADGKQRWDIEVGRRKLYQIFDSYVQFLSRFDGILLRYTAEKERFDMSWKAGTFVVDERVNQFAYVTELSFLDIGRKGFDLKYSYIYWPKNGENRYHVRNPKGWEFINSQVTAYYHFPYEQFNTPVQIFGAFLYNHRAKTIGKVENLTVPNPENPKLPDENAGDVFINSKENIAWYAGVLWGEVRGPGDFSFNLNYQVVQAQAIPDCDVSGISRGNTLNTAFTQPTELAGNGNYRGWHFSFLYGLTNRISIDTSFDFSSAANPRLGGDHEYRNFEVQLIFAF